MLCQSTVEGRRVATSGRVEGVDGRKDSVGIYPTADGTASRDGICDDIATRRRPVTLQEAVEAVRLDSPGGDSVVRVTQSGGESDSLAKRTVLYGGGPE
jgi:hypothetical protein